MNTRANREQLAQIMFETFKVPGLCIANTAVLSLFSSGRTRGVTVEVGGGIMHTVPIFEGFALPHATLSLEAAGQDVTHELKKLLGTSGHEVSYNIARDIKEKLCIVKYRTDVDSSPAEYELPDGNLIE